MMMIYIKKKKIQKIITYFILDDTFWHFSYAWFSVTDSPRHITTPRRVNQHKQWFSCIFRVSLNCFALVFNDLLCQHALSYHTQYDILFPDIPEFQDFIASFFYMKVNMTRTPCIDVHPSSFTGDTIKARTF